MRKLLCIAIVVLTAATCYASPRLRWSKSTGRLPSRAGSNVLRRDAARDATTRTVRLGRPRTVARFTTRAQARLEMRNGIGPRSHFTPQLRPGRPLSSRQAWRRFGLPKAPTVRESVVLRRGTQVRFNKALNGRPGVGEITTVRRVPRQNIRTVVRLKR